jgi:hypothetical protein
MQQLHGSRVYADCRTQLQQAKPGFCFTLVAWFVGLGLGAGTVHLFVGDFSANAIHQAC